MSTTFIPRGVLQPEKIPEPYNGCQCSCHKLPGVKHIMPCCGPGINDKLPFEKLNEQTSET